MITLDFDKLKQSLQLMERNSYQSLCKIEHSSTNPKVYMYLRDIELNDYSYIDGFNKSGSFIIFYQNDIQYCKFSLPVNITGVVDTWKNSKVKTTKLMDLQNRGRDNITSLEVYVNKQKVPDKNILVTIFQDGIDLYIPKKYFSGTQMNQMSLLYNRYSVKEFYFNNYLKVSTSSKITSLDITYNRSQVLIEKNKLNIYRNGVLLYYDRDYSFLDLSTDDSGKFRVSFLIDVVNNDELEFVYRLHTVYDTLYLSKPDSLISIPKSIIRDYPISSSIIEVYNNGLRLFPKDLEEITWRHMKIIDFSNLVGVINNIYIKLNYDESQSELKSCKKYTDVISRFLNTRTENQVSDILLTGHDGVKNQPVPDYMDLLNRSNFFKPTYYPITDSNPLLHGFSSYRDFVISTIKDYLRLNTRNFEYLFSVFKGEDDLEFQYFDKSLYERNSTVNEFGEFHNISFSEPYVVYSFDKRTYKDSTDFTLIVTVENHTTRLENKIFNDEIYFRTLGKKVYLYVKSSFIENNDIVRVKILPIYNKNQMMTNLVIDSNNLYQTIYPISKSILGIIRDERDMIVLKKYQEGHLYMIPGVDYTVNISNTTVDFNIPNKNLGDTFIIYNCSYTKYRSLSFTSDLPTQRTKFPFDILDDSGTYYIPKMTRYTPLLFVGRKRYLINIDYYIVDQSFHSELKVSMVRFKKIPGKDERIELYYTEEKEQSLGHYSRIGGNIYIGQMIDQTDEIGNISVYNIFTFYGLPIPINFDYMDIYADGIKLRPEDVEIISINTFRILWERRVNEVYIITNIDSDIHDYGEFLDINYEHEDEYQEFIEDPTHGHGGESSIDDVYEDSHENETGEELDPTTDENELVSRMSHFMTYVGKQLQDGKLLRKLDSSYHYINEFNKLEYMELMSPEELLWRTIPINCGRRQILPEDTLDIHLDPLESMRAPDEITDLIKTSFETGDLNMMKYDNITGRFTNYNDTELYFKLYEEEVNPIDCSNIINQNSNNVIRLDASVIIV